MNSIDLSGQVAFVTGSSRGIGRACAVRLAQAGADIVMNYVSSRKAALDVAGEISKLNRKCYVLKGDVSEQEDVQCMLDFIREKAGRLDILISNAATGGFRKMLTATKANFDAAFHTNVLALLYLVQASMPLLEKSASHRRKIVTISSHGSTSALPMYGLIGSSKAALESLVRHLTLEVGDKGINVNVVKAGLVATDSTRRLPDADAMFNAQLEYTQVGNRVLQAEDVADTVLFLCSPLSDMIQGETITVDGGSGIRAA
jgi:enoyl-[acyl-carrier protein] reductase III